MPHTGPRSPQPSSEPSGQKDRLSAGPDALFVYGTLQFPEVLHALIDRVPDHTPAAARGWRVTALPGRVYPGLIPAAEHTARGYLLTGLTPAEWRTLDDFEDPVYELRRLDLADGRHGWAYVCDSGAKVLDDAWSYKTFEAEHLPAYIERCNAWRQHHQAHQHGEQVS